VFLNQDLLMRSNLTGYAALDWKPFFKKIIGNIPIIG